MANYFDQFDQPTGDKNFFDQFDEKPEKRDTGFTGAAKAAYEDIKGQGALTLGKIGLMDHAEAERIAATQKAKSEQIFQPTPKGWTEAPGEKIREMLGSTAAYAALPLAAAGAGLLLPEAAAIGGIGAATLGAVGASTAQYTGTNLARQMETGKSLADTNLLNAGAAAFGEGLLDRLSFGAIPGVRQIFAQAGKKLTEETAAQIAKKGVMATAGELALAGGKAAGTEGATEAAQAFLERLQAGLNISDAAARDEYFQNFIGGAILGGVVGVPGRAFELRGAKTGAVPEQEAEAPPPKVSEIYPTAQPVTMAGLEPIAPIEPTVAPIPTEAPISPVAQAPAVTPTPAAEAAPVVAPEAAAPVAKTQQLAEIPHPFQAELNTLYKDKNKLLKSKDDLNLYLRKVGINPKEKADMGIEKNNKSYPGIFRQSALGLDVLMHDAIENGIITESDLARYPDPVEGFRQMAKAAIDGAVADTPQNMANMAELESIQSRIEQLESIPKEEYGLQAETAEESQARMAQEATAKKAQEDADVQAEMDAKAQAYKEEIARRSQQQAGTFSLGQTPMESLTGQQRMDEDIPFERATPYADKFIAAERKLASTLRSSLDKMGLKNVAVNLEDRLHEIRNGQPTDVNGYYFQQMINLSLAGDNIFRTMNHEALHAMKDLGFFTDAEWKLLESKAKSTWMKKYDIAKDYGDKSLEIQYEEAIAKAFADKQTQEPKIKSIMDHAITLLKRIGNVLRGQGFTSAEDVFAKAAEGKLKPTVPTAKGELRAERTYSNAPPKAFTKLAPQQTAGEKIQTINANVKKAWNDDNFWTGLRNAWIDPNSGLTKSLKNLPTFDSNGQLRADMVSHSQAQSINLIKNGMLTGMPTLNKDGSIIIDASENNLARSQTIADSIDTNPLVKASGLSGRGFIAEVARAMRGKELLEEDQARHKFGADQLKMAKDIIQQVKQARDEGRPVGEIRKLLDRARTLRKQGYENKAANRELQVTPEQIAWAEKQLKDVPEVQQVLDIWKNVNDSLVSLWEQVGLLTKDQADNYRSKKSYVPLYKAREDLSDMPTGYGGTGLKTAKEIKRLKGADIDRNIWENVEKHYASMIASAYQNQTRKVGVNQLKTFDLARVTKADDPDVNLRYRDPTDPNADLQGIVHAVVENPNDLAAFQMMHYELGPIMKGFAAANQVLRAGALLNPMFWIKQLIRDPVHATLVTNSGIITPFHAAKGYIDVLRGDSREAGILARAGVIGQMDSTMDLQDFLKHIGMEKKDPSFLSKALHKAMKFHEASDAATRVAIFKDQEKQALAKGMSKEDAVNYAVFKARESINFAIHGNSPTINALRNMIPFLSATINSLDTVYRAASGYGLNEKEKKAAQTMFVKRAVMMSVMATAYAMLYQGDEDYKKLPDYVKDNNFLLPNPFGDGHTFIKIPTPFEVGFLFKTIPEASVRYMAGNSTGKEVLASYLQGVTNVIPGNGVPLPQAVKPAIEAITNYSFFTHRPVESVGEQNLPTAMRGERASEVAKQLSALGLDKIGLSPAKIDYLIQGYTAELGAFSMNMASSAIDVATGKERTAKNIEEMPFMKSFMTNPKSSKAIADFYDLAHTAQETVNEFNNYKKFGESEKIKELMADEQNRKLISAAPILRGIQGQMTALRVQMKMIDKNQNMDPEIRKERLNNLQQTYEKLALQGDNIAKAMKIEK
jgi:hypothetical protein